MATPPPVTIHIEAAPGRFAGYLERGGEHITLDAVLAAHLFADLAYSSPFYGETLAADFETLLMRKGEAP